ncbi:hypothetical protein VSR68_19550 [Paraburkholderia phymatum]|uniref:hypothetical protein n=1 Tax=Paraburkholderia phymatum TaxID=148447 RepID=UPI003181021C
MNRLLATRPRGLALISPAASVKMDSESSAKPLLNEAKRNAQLNQAEPCEKTVDACGSAGIPRVRASA